MSWRRAAFVKSSLAHQVKLTVWSFEIRLPLGSTWIKSITTRRSPQRFLTVKVNMLNAMWICVAAYFVAQCYTVMAWRGSSRIAALVPLVGMVPVAVVTVQMYRQQSNIWPALLLLAAPPALLYLVILMIARVSKNKSHNE